MQLSVIERLAGLQMILSRYLDPMDIEQVSLDDDGVYIHISHPDLNTADILLNDFKLLRTLGAFIIRPNTVVLEKEPT